MPEPVKITVDRLRRRLSELLKIPMREVQPQFPPEIRGALTSRLRRERRFPKHYRQFYPHRRR